MILLKTADISNEVRPLEVAEPWIECLLEEFFIQVVKIITTEFTSLWSKTTFILVYMVIRIGLVYKCTVKNGMGLLII